MYFFLDLTLKFKKLTDYHSKFESTIQFLGLFGEIACIEILSFHLTNVFKAQFFMFINKLHAILKNKSSTNLKHILNHG